MENTIENVDAVEVIDSTKKIKCRIKKRPDENTIVDYLCKSYPDCNETTKGLLTWKIKIKS